MVSPQPARDRAVGAHDELPRVLGFTSVVGILVGTVIGSGVFSAMARDGVFFRTFAGLHPRLLRPPVIFILAALYISASTLVTDPRRAAAGLAIILAGVPACLYWRKRLPWQKRRVGGPA